MIEYYEEDYDLISFHIQQILTGEMTIEEFKDFYLLNVENDNMINSYCKKILKNNDGGNKK